MRKKILYVFLIIMLAVNAVLLYLIIDKRMNKSPKQGRSYLIEELHFSKEQKDQFFLLDEEHRKRMMKIDDESLKLRELLFSSYDTEAESRDSLMIRFGNLEAERQDELFSFFGKVRELCDEEQVKKFDEIIQKALHRRGPKPPGGKHGGPPRH